MSYTYAMRCSRKVSSLVTILLIIFPSAVAVASSNDLMANFAELERQNGLPSGVLRSIAMAESGGNPNARNPTSGALGYFQWIAKYWGQPSREVFGRELRPEYRADPMYSAQVTAHTLAQANYALGGLIDHAHVDKTLGLYMAHFLGIGGAKKFLLGYIQNPGGQAACQFATEAKSNRGVFGQCGSGRTYAQLLNEMAKRLSRPGVPNAQGTFADSNGVLYAVGGGNVKASDFYPENYKSPDYPSQRTYETTEEDLKPWQPGQGESGHTSGGEKNEINASQKKSLAKNPSVAGLVIQPHTVKVGGQVLFSWTSINMSTENPCIVAFGAQQSAPDNEGTLAYYTTEADQGTIMVTLHCTAADGKPFEKKESVIVQ